MKLIFKKRNKKYRKPKVRGTPRKNPYEPKFPAMDYDINIYYEEMGEAENTTPREAAADSPRVCKCSSEREKGSASASKREDTQIKVQYTEDLQIEIERLFNTVGAFPMTKKQFDNIAAISHSLIYEAMKAGVETGFTSGFNAGISWAQDMEDNENYVRFKGKYIPKPKENVPESCDHENESVKDTEVATE